MKTLLIKCKLIVIVLFILNGCAPYKVPTESFKAVPHPLYKTIPRHRSQIQWYDGLHWTTWALFGNDDGGLFGENHPHPYKPKQEANGFKALQWGFRNPLHNFCHYVIGTAYCQNSEFLLFELSHERIAFLTYKPNATRIYASKGTGFYAALHGWKPFISLRVRYSESKKGEIYFGWRNRGNFGIKFVPWTRTQKK